MRRRMDAVRGSAGDCSRVAAERGTLRSELGTMSPEPSGSSHGLRPFSRSPTAIRRLWTIAALLRPLKRLNPLAQLLRQLTVVWWSG